MSNTNAKALLVLLIAALVPACKREDSPHQKIVFDSDRDGNPEIYVMDPDGSNQQRLTENKGSDEFPRWSPDGKRIAFASDREGHYEIYVMASDGSNLERLTRMAGKDNVNPAWSPDGKKIAFESGRDEGWEQGSWEIWVMNVDGSNPLRLTHTKGTGKSSENPDWSPDGKRIAFDSDRDGNWEIYVMDSDGSNLRQLTRRPDKTFGSEHAIWSPDGKKIAFDSSWDRIGKKWEEVLEIYVMQADGSNVQQLTDGRANLVSRVVTEW